MKKNYFKILKVCLILTFLTFTLFQSIISSADRPEPNSILGERLTNSRLSKRLQFFMQLRINRHFREFGKYPQNVKQIVKAIEGPVPNEQVSASSRISFIFDKTGGWFFDLTTGKISPNIPENLQVDREDKEENSLPFSLEADLAFCALETLFQIYKK